MAQTPEPVVATDGKGISTPPAEDGRGPGSPEPTDTSGTAPASDATDDDLSTTGKGIS